jgi:hypothetical protein
MNYSVEELERAAYIGGFSELANLYDKAATLETLDADLPMGFNIEAPMDLQIEGYIEQKIADRCPNDEAYRVFFYECFDRLNAHYPCPSVTSDYDCSVVFDAISKGDTA